jgi:hypothetical protein
VADIYEHDNVTFVSRRGGKMSVPTEGLFPFQGQIQPMELFYGVAYTHRVMTSKCAVTLACELERT